MNQEHDNDNPACLSIGALSRLSGIPVETIRNWERRYGWPAPVRIHSGHRRYLPELVHHLRLANSALALGFKPSYITAVPWDELEAAVRLARSNTSIHGGIKRNVGHRNEIKEWLNSAEYLDAERFETALKKCWHKHGAEVFICDVAAPFWLHLRDWSDDRFSSVHEHFASELLSCFLATQWRSISTDTRSCKVTLTAFEGAPNPLYLHMAAVFFALHNIEVVFLGANTPIEDIVIATLSAGAVAIMVHCDPTSDALKSRYLLTNLREAIPPAVTIFVSGFDGGPPLRGVSYAETTRDLLALVRTLCEVHNCCDG